MVLQAFNLLHAGYIHKVSNLSNTDLKNNIYQNFKTKNTYQIDKCQSTVVMMFNAFLFSGWTQITSMIKYQHINK